MLFPQEWKNIALTLQLQRIPNEWDTASFRPVAHTLKSWINSKKIINININRIDTS